MARNRYESVIAQTGSSAVSSNKVLKNTYLLLSATLGFSAVMAMVSMAIGVPPITYLVAVIAAMVLGIFVLPRTANSTSGLGVIFGITGLLGFGLGSVLSMYLSLPNGPQVIATAFAGTGIIFLGLSGYALVSRRDFSFMGSFLMVGVLVAFLAGLGAVFFGLSALALAVSAMFVLLMAGLILYETSNIIHGGETNYIMATVTLYVAIYNLFTSLLHLLGAFSSQE